MTDWYRDCGWHKAEVADGTMLLIADNDSWSVEVGGATVDSGNQSSLVWSKRCAEDAARAFAKAILADVGEEA